MDNTTQIYDEILLLCDGIIERSNHMTSGNFMHEKSLQIFYANQIKENIKTLLEHGEI